MKTVHLVFNAHIDPIWLWPWTSGLDSVLNTCETMCRLLDKNSDVTFTRGEAWAYEQIERIDPALFRRIQAHVSAGRWEVAGGWYIQPDCNLPGIEGFRKQIELGRDYFRSRFGQFPKYAYNVDSFGHASILPRLMREAGQTHYVMMRPQEHEMKLPARLFRWRGEKNGPEVTVFRIAGQYNIASLTSSMKKEDFEKCVTELPEGVDDTMCFLGIGDHGGGPTQAMIDWCRANPEPMPGVRLKFSSPSQFFHAVARHEKKLPVVEGDLQMHAIGCYSVYRRAKTEVRRAENLLLQAGEALKSDRELARATATQRESAWKRTCFHHFHDTMGGTCIPSAYPYVFDQLGEACSTGEEIIQTALRRHVAKLPANEEQRLVLANGSGAPWHDWVEHEPWLEKMKDDGEWTVRDERGRVVPHQRTMREAQVTHPHPRLLFRLAIQPGERRVLRIAQKSPTMTPWKTKPRWKISAGHLVGAGKRWRLPVLRLIEDKTDTWSHGIHSFEGPVKAEARWQKPVLIEKGPLLEAWWMEGKIGDSPLAAEWRCYADSPFFELRLRVAWREKHRLLRLEWKPGPLAATREDGVPGGGLRRANDGRERPVRDRTLLKLSGGKSAGAVFPGVFSLGATRAALRLTLLRSSQLAQHDPPVKEKFHRERWSDQGEQDFVLRFHPRGATAAQLDRDALALQRPPAIATLTRGMPEAAGVRQADG
jgi:alpha-mannosidase